MILTRIAATIVASVFLLPSAYAQCSLSFATPPSFPAGNQPRTLVVANLNRDAYPDLVVGSWDQNNLPVAGLGLLAGGPKGSLQLTDLLYDGHQVQEVVSGDFDADGDDDVAILDGGGGDGTVRMLRNDSGTFVESGSFVVPHTATFEPGLDSGDFNGDGRADVVFLSPSDAFVFISRADGGFERKIFGQGFDLRPLVADLDGDGRDELITGRFSPSVTTLEIFSGDAAAGLVRTRQITVGASKYRLAAGDFDGDGAIDLVALGNGPADFIYTAGTATEVTATVALYLPGATLMVADLDRDGVDDLVFETSTEAVGAAFGRRDRTMVQGRDVWLPGRNDAAFGPSGIAVADFDLDGDVDVVATESTGVVLLKNAGDGSLQSPRFARYAVLAVGDFNNDGRDDVVDENGVALAAPDGSFQPGDDSFRGLYDWTLVSDFNRDGKLDAIYYTRFSSDVRLGNGDGTLGKELHYTAHKRAEMPFIADVNGDGFPDLGQANQGGDGISIGIGNGDGTFREPIQVAVNGNLREVAPGDFNGDGRIDLAVTRAAQGITPLVVLLNDGTGHFGPAATAAESGGDLVRTGDLNGDGLSDIITGSNRTIWIHVNTRSGFAPPVQYDVRTTFLEEIVVRDFNSDGHLDLLVTDGPTTGHIGLVGLLPGDGNGGFAPLQQFRGVLYSDVFVGDFNGDGHLDLLDGGFMRFGSCGGGRRRAARH